MVGEMCLEKLIINNLWANCFRFSSLFTEYWIRIICTLIAENGIGLCCSRARSWLACTRKFIFTRFDCGTAEGKCVATGQCDRGLRVWYMLGACKTKIAQHWPFAARTVKRCWPLRVEMNRFLPFGGGGGGGGWRLFHDFTFLRVFLAGMRVTPKVTQLSSDGTKWNGTISRTFFASKSIFSTDESLLSVSSTDFSLHFLFVCFFGRFHRNGTAKAMDFVFYANAIRPRIDIGCFFFFLLFIL